MPILPFQGFGLVPYPTHESSQIVSRFPHDLGAQCGLLASSHRIELGHERARMNIARYIVFLVLGMLLGLLLSALLSSLTTWLWG